SSAYASNGLTRITVALESATAEPDRVRLAWQASEQIAANLYRRQDDADWILIGRVLPDGLGQIAYEDRDVTPGARYGYRLGYGEEGAERFAGEVWVTIPTGLGFALDGLEPNPAAADLVVSFTLPTDAPATLEMVDVSGRRLLARPLTGLPAGRHTLR